MSDDNNNNDVFSKENTIGQSQSWIVTYLVLQQWFGTIKQYEAYLNSTDGSGVKNKNGIRIKSSLKALLIMLGTRLKTKNKLEKIENNVSEDKYEEALKLLAEYLEEDLKITNIATLKDVNMSSITDRNKVYLGY